MTLRKTAGALAAFGLIVGLLGSGVAASFSDFVTGTENISVGTFDCQVTAATGGSFDANSATYNAPQITSSAPGSAPFAFDVKNVSSSPMALSVSGPVWGGTLDGSFTGMAATLSAATLAPGATSTVSTGIQWTALDNADLGASGSATWTVNCGEVPAPVTYVSAQFSFGDGGWAGWSCGASEDIISATFQVISGNANYTMGLAKTGQTTDGSTYPVYPHYTFGVNEEGAVLHNVLDGSGGVATLTIVCQP